MGEDVGAYLVEHPDVSFVAFTGSKDVGLHIIEAAAVHRPGQRHVKRVVAEMGGKNALVVDADADLDQAVPIALGSAFGYAGQKCSALSRLIVVDAVYDQVVERVAGAARQLRVGHPREMGTDLGPAHRRRGLQAGAVATSSWRRRRGGWWSRDGDVPDAGMVRGADGGGRREGRQPPGHRGDLRAGAVGHAGGRRSTHAIELANATDYALTAGVLSRSPAHIRLAEAELRAGNVYVNRSITGAVVGRHPFGGYGLSGVGSKAGGPDYLLQFLEPRAVSENTLRQGFVPGEDDDRSR